MSSIISKNTPMAQAAKMTNGARLFWRSFLSKDLYEPHAIAAVLPHLTDEDLWLSLSQAKSLLKGDGSKYAQITKIEEKFNFYKESFQCRPEWWLGQFSAQKKDDEIENWDDRKKLLLSAGSHPPFKIRLMTKSKKMLFFSEEESNFFEHFHITLASELSNDNRAWFAEKALEKREYGAFFALRDAANGLSSLWDGYKSYHEKSAKAASSDILFGLWLNNDDKAVKAKQNVWLRIRTDEAWDVDTNLKVLSVSPIWVESFLRDGNLPIWENIFGQDALKTDKVETFLWSRALCSTWHDESCFLRVKKLLENNIKLPDVPWPNEFLINIKPVAGRHGNARRKSLPDLLKQAKECGHQWFKTLKEEECRDIALALIESLGVGGKTKQPDALLSAMDNLVLLTGRNSWINLPFIENPLEEKTVLHHKKTIVHQAVELKSEDFFRWCLKEGADVSNKVSGVSIEDILQKRKISTKTLSAVLTEFKLMSIGGAATRKAKAKI